SSVIFSCVEYHYSFSGKMAKFAPTKTLPYPSFPLNQNTHSTMQCIKRFPKFRFAISSTLRFYNKEMSLANFNVKPTPPVKLYKTDKSTITTDELFPPGKTVVMFGLPGAFTPVCSSKHVSKNKIANLSDRK